VLDAERIEDCHERLSHDGSMRQEHFEERFLAS
jgi:hypothetical protein